jgi:hypothetical protein
MPLQPALVKVAASSAEPPGRVHMLFDDVVLTGALTIGLALLFVTSLAVYIWKDSRRGD